MLKKAAHIIITLTLLFATTGVMVSKHYCGNKLRDIAVMKVPAACCDSDTCCHTESEFYQLDDGFILEVTDFQPPVQKEISVISVFYIEQSQCDLSVYSNFYLKYPPPAKPSLSVIQSFLL
ncbi:MAG TPA: hypothetical protein VJ877_00820 [Bacteroidales bacterium]|nr:hypothetical protein [Bacteroidales bacterium]